MMEAGRGRGRLSVDQAVHNDVELVANLAVLEKNIVRGVNLVCDALAQLDMHIFPQLGKERERLSVTYKPRNLQLKWLGNPKPAFIRAENLFNKLSSSELWPYSWQWRTVSRSLRSASLSHRICSGQHKLERRAET